MSIRHTLHLRGHRLVEPRQPFEAPERPAWMTDLRRRCSPVHRDAAQWTSDDQSDLTLAARKCRDHCPFLDECRDRAAEQNERHFAWGGLVFSKAEDRARAADMREAAVA